MTAGDLRKAYPKRWGTEYQAGQRSTIHLPSRAGLGLAHLTVSKQSNLRKNAASSEDIASSGMTREKEHNRGSRIVKKKNLETIFRL